MLLRNYAGRAEDRSYRAGIGVREIK